MTLKPETLPETLKVTLDKDQSVTALLYRAGERERAGMTILLGHGAGANQTSSFMRLCADGLARRGFDAMTFNFLYAEQGRRAPDPGARLEFCYRAVIDVALAHKKLKGNQLVIGGKSMGGRIASQVAAREARFADGDSSSLSKAPTAQKKIRAPAEVRAGDTRIADSTGNGIAALVFLGYPLHPPGKPEQLRSEHLKNVRAPMLFVQGSRDAFGKPDELRAVIAKLQLPATLYVVEGGDHSFKVLKSSTLTQQQVYEAAMNEIARWLQVDRRK